MSLSRSEKVLVTGGTGFVGRAARVGAGELDRVLDRLGAGVEEGDPDFPRDGSEPDEALCETDVALVGNDREVRVGEERDLLLQRLDDPRVRVADVEAADAAREVHERVPVHVREQGAPGLADDDGEVDGERVGDDAGLALEDLTASRARDLGPDVDRSSRCHRASSL